MAIIGYSPWQEAAQYGEGLGRTLSQAMLQQPALRAQLGMERARFAQEQQLFPLQQQLLQAQVGYEQARPGIEQARYQNTAAMNQRRMQSMDVNDAYRKAATEKIENPQTKPPTPMQRVNMESKISGGMVPEKNAQGITQNLGSDALQYILDMVMKGGTVAGALPQLQSVPDLRTNMVPNHLGMALFGQHPQVTTNSFTLRPPMGGMAPMQSPTNQVPQTAVNPQTGQRIQLVNGQWMPIQ